MYKIQKILESAPPLLERKKYLQSVSRREPALQANLREMEKK